MKNKKILIFSIFFLVLIAIMPAAGRYVGKKVRNYYLSTKNFYFNSDKLEEDGIIYQTSNWSGVDSYSVTFNMNSYKNNTVAATSDIEYNISYTCSDNVNCSISKTSGIIYTATHMDAFTITMTPKKSLEDNDSAWVEVTANATSPYTKTLKGRFNVAVGRMGLSYEVIDEENSPFFEVSITNTLNYYVVREKFGNYNVGDKIDIDKYVSLSDSDKNKCASSIVSLGFNPNTVLLDMTTSAYLEATDISETEVNGYNYINGFSFKIDALSSSRVRFYKVDSKRNYTFPFVNNTSIVSVDFD